MCDTSWVLTMCAHTSSTWDAHDVPSPSAYNSNQYTQPCLNNCNEKWHRLTFIYDIWRCEQALIHTNIATSTAQKKDDTLGTALELSVLYSCSTPGKHMSFSKFFFFLPGCTANLGMQMGWTANWPCNMSSTALL